MDQQDFQIISIMASREAEFYVKTREKLLASLPPFIGKSEARRRLRRAISELDNLLFIGEEEKASETIDPKLSVSQLKLNNQEILDQVMKAMTKG